MKPQKSRLAVMIAILVALAIISPAASVKAGSPETASSAAILQDANPERIRFALGTTSADVSGEITTRVGDRYILRAAAGQLMEVTLSGPEGVQLTVATEGGRVLSEITGSATSFRGYLPRNGDYILTLTSRSRPASYSLYVSIPQRISFERGTTSATLEKELERRQSHDYILRAQAGQLLEINITPEKPGTSLQLIIYGADGTVLRSGMGEGSSFRGELPLSEDYIVTVRAGEQDVSFTMDVIIPRQIRFQPGAFSDTQRGSLKAHRSQYYSLSARKAQDMRVEVTSNVEVQLIIYGEDGTVLMSGMGEGASFKGKLPSTQNYVLVVRSGDRRAAYSLDVTIR